MYDAKFLRESYESSRKQTQYKESENSGIEGDHPRISDGEHIENLQNNFDNYSEKNITGRTSIDSTSEIVSIDVLEKLLKDEEYVSKFLDFDNNSSLFQNSKQAIISALEIYVDGMTKVGDTYIDNEGNQINMGNYNKIISQSGAINDLNSITNDGKFYYMGHGNPKQNVPANYLNSTLFTDSGYDMILKDASHESPMIAYNYLIPFRNLYVMAKNSDMILNAKTIERLEFLNSMYIELIGKNRNILGKYTEYGANQNAVMKIALNPALNLTLYNSLEKIVKDYFPEIRNSKINKLLRGIDVKGVCSYATVVNELLIEYNNREQDFKRDFGYDLYRIENGQLVVNAEEIITDLYCFANRFNLDIFDGRYVVQKIGNDKKAAGMSHGTFGKNTKTINEWLKSKEINATWSSNILFASNAPGLGDLAIERIRDNISTVLVRGNQVELDFFMDKSNPISFYLYPTDGSTAYKMSNSHHALGHSVEVTGIDNNGDLIISSWGKEYVIKFDDLRNLEITIIESNLYYNHWN